VAIKIQIFDGAVPMLDEIAAANYGQGLDALDHAGNAIRKTTRIAMGSLHEWKQRFVRKDGKLKRYIEKSGSNLLGRRYNHKTGDIASPSNMSNFITSYLNAKNMTMVVGGMHPAHTPVTRRNGQIVGTQKRQAGVSKSSYAILQKLNSGETDGDYRTLVRPRSMKRFANAAYKNRNFADRGRAMASSRVNDIMTTKLEEMIHRQINRTRVKYREVKTS